VEELFPVMEKPFPAGLKAWLVDLPVAYEPEGKRSYLVFCVEPPVTGRTLVLRPVIEGSLISGPVMWASFELGEALLQEIWIGAALEQRIFIEGV